MGIHPAWWHSCSSENSNYWAKYGHVIRLSASVFFSQPHNSTTEAPRNPSSLPLPLTERKPHPTTTTNKASPKNKNPNWCRDKGSLSAQSLMCNMDYFMVKQDNESPGVYVCLNTLISILRSEEGFLWTHDWAARAKPMFTSNAPPQYLSGYWLDAADNQHPSRHITTSLEFNNNKSNLSASLPASILCFMIDLVKNQKKHKRLSSFIRKIFYFMICYLLHYLLLRTQFKSKKTIRQQETNFTSFITICI